MFRVLGIYNFGIFTKKSQFFSQILFSQFFFIKIFFFSGTSLPQYAPMKYCNQIFIIIAIDTFADRIFLPKMLKKSLTVMWNVP